MGQTALVWKSRVFLPLDTVWRIGRNGLPRRSSRCMPFPSFMTFGLFFIRPHFAYVNQTGNKTVSSLFAMWNEEGVKK